MAATKPSEQIIVKAHTPPTLSVPVGRCRILVRGFSASIRRSARRLKAIAALRAATMQRRMPGRSSQRNGRGGVSRTFRPQAIAAAKSAKGSAKSVWLKRIISRMWRRRRSMLTPLLPTAVSTNWVSQAGPKSCATTKSIRSRIVFTP